VLVFMLDREVWKGEKRRKKKSYVALKECGVVSEASYVYGGGKPDGGRRGVRPKGKTP